MSAPFPSFTKKWHTTAYPAIDVSRPGLSLKGKNVLITGGGKGIGAATARHFALAGANILISGRTEATLIQTTEAIKKQSPTVRVLYEVADVTNQKQFDSAVQKFFNAVGAFDVLVSNAGMLADNSNIKDLDIDTWLASYESMVKGALIAVQGFLHHANPAATIINVSTSVAHVYMGPGWSLYSSSKVAAINIFDYLQAEDPTLHVVSIAPGIVATDMSRKGGFPGMDEG
jgi:NAD(P)-dependent dehydrogenase (short-subunit alcohol dehydrogenase family)